MTNEQELFIDLFVLEGALNHLGSLERGLKLIRDHGRVCYANGVKASYKFQLRDMSTFVHKDFRDRKDLRYVAKSMSTRLSREDYKRLADEVRRQGMILSSTCFDEASVEFAVELDVQILKVASSDINDYGLLRKMASTKLPVIISTGGMTQESIDSVVRFFENRKIPLAINSCCSLYPTEDEEMELNQIDFLRNRYPGHVIGLSTHEYKDWWNSMLISYAKGARTWERHVDVETDGMKVSPYCSLPHQMDRWFQAHRKAKELCGAPGTERRVLPQREIEYLDALVRGAYAAKDMEPGNILQDGDLYLAVPLQKGQVCNREHLSRETLVQSILKDEPLTVDHLGSSYPPEIVARIKNRGL